MNYRHSYHAGNFSDVFKHIVLIALMQSFHRKETPFCYLETHAGTGCYDLFSEAAQKSKEYENGVSKIFTAKNPPDLVQDYLTCVKKINSTDELRNYPGSPFFAQEFLRSQDRMVLSELHIEDVKMLQDTLCHDKRIAIHHQDGYQTLKAFLPPKERRGLILIDPPYEKSDELMTMPIILAEAIKRFETGIYVLWYPIKNRALIERFYRELKVKIKRPTLTTELSIYGEIPTHLSGNGLAIINPPWQFDQQLAALLPWLWSTLSINQQGRFQSSHF